MKGIYLCAREHRLPGYHIVYNDIDISFKPDLCCSCDEIDLSLYDFIIATPPCNYWSRANYRRNSSNYSLLTKNLLPYCINACIKTGKPFIVENVLNKKLIKPFQYECFYYEYGQHCYFSNILLPSIPKDLFVKQNKAGVCRNKRDNNYNVDLVIKVFLQVIS